MDMDVYRKIIDDFGSRGGVVTFGTFGEPLMDKYVQERIEYLKRYPKIQKAEVLTNGFFLNEKIVPTLLEHGVGVDISLDELDKQTFEDVKKMSFDVVRDNIVDFLEANSKMVKPVAVNIHAVSPELKMGTSSARAVEGNNKINVIREIISTLDFL